MPTMRFNGAAPFQERKGRFRLRTEKLHGGFNGAAPFQERKDK